jgi:hypothetical protein
LTAAVHKKSLIFARLFAWLEAADFVVNDFLLFFESADGGYLAGETELFPLCRHFVVHLSAQRSALREDRQVPMLFAGIN